MATTEATPACIHQARKNFSPAWRVRAAEITAYFAYRSEALGKDTGYSGYLARLCQADAELAIEALHGKEEPSDNGRLAT